MTSPNSLKILMVGHGYGEALGNMTNYVMNFVHWNESKSAKKRALDKHYDLVVLTGGEDISPAIYGETDHKIWPNQARDEYELKVIKKFQGKVPIVGICRGLQILWASSGGKLIHDIKDYKGAAHPYHHIMNLAVGWRPKSNNAFTYINSLHHQAARLEAGIPDGWEIIGTAHDGIPEAAINFDLMIGGVQYHPESMNNDDGGREIWDMIVGRLLNHKAKLV